MKWLNQGLLLLLILGASACSSVTGSTISRPSMKGFGPTDSMIVFSYTVSVVPPADLPQWKEMKVASLPVVHLAEMRTNGTVSPAAARALVSENELALPLGTMVGHSIIRVQPGNYSFVRVIDLAQRDGVGLACVDVAGRPYSGDGVLRVGTGTKLYAGHINMTVKLSKSGDPTILDASFERLDTEPGTYDITKTPSSGQNPLASSTLQPQALASCKRIVFGDLVGRKAQCNGVEHDEVKKLFERHKNKYLSTRKIEKATGARFLLNPQPVLLCSE